MIDKATLETTLMELRKESKRAWDAIGDGDEDDSGWRRRATVYAKDVERAEESVARFVSWIANLDYARAGEGWGDCIPGSDHSCICEVSR